VHRVAWWVYPGIQGGAYPVYTGRYIPRGVYREVHTQEVYLTGVTYPGWYTSPVLHTRVVHTRHDTWVVHTRHDTRVVYTQRWYLPGWCIYPAVLHTRVVYTRFHI